MNSKKLDERTVLREVTHAKFMNFLFESILSIIALFIWSPPFDERDYLVLGGILFAMTLLHIIDAASGLWSWHKNGLSQKLEHARLMKLVRKP